MGIGIASRKWPRIHGLGTAATGGCSTAVQPVEKLVLLAAVQPDVQFAVRHVKLVVDGHAVVEE